jgi:hypothetical protein
MAPTGLKSVKHAPRRNVGKADFLKSIENLFFMGASKNYTLWNAGDQPFLSD